MFGSNPIRIPNVVVGKMPGKNIEFMSQEALALRQGNSLYTKD